MVTIVASTTSYVEANFKETDLDTTRAHVIMDVVKNRHIAEILFHWREHTLTAKDTNADMYQALTRCIDKIEKQAVKLKKKIIERKQDAVPLSAVAPDPSPADAGAGEAAAPAAER